MPPLRFALLGAGFWSRYQLAGWRELPGAECVAIYNRTMSKAQRLAEEFGVAAVYDDPKELLRREELDFVDVVTAVETHAEMVHLAAEGGLSVICQKPMATSLPEAEGMVAACRDAGVGLYVHENWRWQAPIRELRRRLDSGRIGRPFRAVIDYSSSFPVFANQPFLKELDQFIVADMGSHLLDTARFLFGEADDVYSQTCRVHADIRGEDVATVMMRMGGGVTVVCMMSYASRTERERFPETFIHVEGEEGSLELAPDFWIRETTAEGTRARRHPPPRYEWADPRYDVVHASIVECSANLLGALRGDASAETTGVDNLRTVRLVYGAYESAAEGRMVRPSAPDGSV